MKPLVLYAKTVLFDSVTEFWHIIHSPKEKSKNTACTKEEAMAVIERYQLPLSYQDENGKIWAEEYDNPLAAIRHRREFNRESRHELNSEKFRVLAEYGIYHPKKGEIL